MGDVAVGEQLSDWLQFDGAEQLVLRVCFAEAVLVHWKYTWQLLQVE